MSLNPEIIDGTLYPKLYSHLKEKQIIKYDNVQFKAKCDAADP